jgi:hypothetical protein
MEKIKSDEILHVVSLFGEMEDSHFQSLLRSWTPEMVNHLLILLKDDQEKKIEEYVLRREELILLINQLSPLAIFPETLKHIESTLQALKQENQKMTHSLLRAVSLAFQTNNAEAASHFGNLRLRLDSENALLEQKPLDEKLYTFFINEEGKRLEDAAPLAEGLIWLGCSYENDFKNLGFPDVGSGITKLQGLGLKSVGDLRKERIYSLSLLQEWLLKHS